MLKPGDTGKWVGKLQWRLHYLGYDVKVTGVYDAPTIAAVKRFQAKHGYTPTGNCSRWLSMHIRWDVRRAYKHQQNEPDTPFEVQKGVDYAWQPYDAKALQRAGIQFVMRYLSHSAAKNLQAHELSALRDDGFGVGLVWETSANRALDGTNAGIQDAKDARAQLVALGLPESQPICFAVDFDMQPAQAGRVTNYFAGAASVLGPKSVGVYGGLAAVRTALNSQHARHAWQTYAWSRGQWDPRAAIRQVKNGVTIGAMHVDLDEQHADTPLIFA